MLRHGAVDIGLGLLSVERSDPRARQALEETLRLKRLVDDRSGIAYALAGIACAADSETAPTWVG